MITKYRVWDSANNKMQYYEEQLGFQTRDDLLKDSAPECQRMPITGFQDRDGKDIYEGDILKTDTTSKALVVWAGDQFDLRWLRTEWPTEMNVRTRYTINDEINSPRKMTVIGNKFENPDTLRKGKNVIYLDED